MPQRHVYTTLILFLIFILTYMGFSSMYTTRGKIILAGMALFPILVFMVNHPVLWIASAILVFQSTIRVPGAPEKFGLYELMLAGLAGMLVAYRIIDKETIQPRATNRKLLMMFAGLLVFTMLYRGIGIRALGSPLWGGSVYIILILGIVFMLYIDMVKIEAKVWRNAMIGMCALSFLPFVAQLLLHVSHGSMVWIYRFVQPVGFLAETFQNDLSGSGVERYNSGFAVIALFVPLIWFRKPLLGWALPVTAVLGTITVFFIALSGSRYTILLAILFIGIWTMLGGRRIKIKGPLMLAILGVCALLIVGYFAIYLPNSMQRAFSWIPGSRTTITAQISGSSTMDWRFILWERAISDLWANPQWLFIGQGLAFDPSGFEGLVISGDFSYEWAFVCRAYHHGILSLLLIFGIPGLVIGAGILITTSVRHIKLSQQSCGDELLNRIYRVVLAYFCARMVLFLTVGGDVQNYFPIFLFFGAMLEGIARARRDWREDDDDEEEELVFASPIPSAYAMGPN